MAPHSIDLRCKPLIAAVGNAIFDATGVRVRRVPSGRRGQQYIAIADGDDILVFGLVE